jgi:hypothetical protein
MIKKYRILAETPEPFVTRTWQVGDDGQPLLFDMLVKAEEAMAVLREGAADAVAFIAQEIEFND